MDRGAGWAMVYRAAKNRTRLKRFSTAWHFTLLVIRMKGIDRHAQISMVETDLATNYPDSNDHK